MQAFYTELEKRLWEAADFPSGLILNSSLPNIPSPFSGWFFCSTLTISLPWFHGKLQREALGGARWVRRITRHSWALYLPETARFEYLIDRPEALDLGGAINAALTSTPT
jgi:type I restriction enzyme M protein